MIMLPIMHRNSWLPSVFDDFFNTDEGNLTIKMEQKQENKDENKKAHYLRREFSYSKYEQTLLLPDDVDKDKISAKVNDGVLTVELPKLEQSVQNVGRQISVE